MAVYHNEVITINSFEYVSNCPIFHDELHVDRKSLVLERLMPAKVSINNIHILVF